MRERDSVGSCDEVLAAATRATGLTDLGDHGHEEGLRVLLDSYATEAGLTPAGNHRMRGTVKGLLAAKLVAQQGFLAHPSYADVPVERPVFVMGLPRSGTTLVQRLLTADPAHQGLEQWLADLPQPRPPRESWDDDLIFSAMQQGYLAFHEANPELAGIHYSDATTHEECWRLLQHSGMSVAFETQAHVPSYSRWLQEQDWKPAYEAHRRLLQLIGSNDPDRRWVLKNPSHLVALDALLGVYPDAVVVVTHRDPVVCTASMCSLAEASTRGLSTTFTGDVIGRTQLDLLAREQAAFRSARGAAPFRSARGAAAFRSARGAAPTLVDVEYDDLVGDPVGTIRGVYAEADLPWSDAVAAAVSDELERSSSGVRAPRHAYDLADYGLTTDEVRSVLEP